MNVVFLTYTENFYLSFSTCFSLFEFVEKVEEKNGEWESESERAREWNHHF